MYIRNLDRRKPQI